MRNQSGSIRVHRVQKELMQILGTYLISHLQPWTGGRLLTISQIHISPDLKVGWVYLSPLMSPAVEGSILNDDHEAQTDKEVLETLNKERHSEIQRYIGKNLKTKFCPKLTFRWDDGLLKQLAIENTLRSLKISSTEIGV